MHLWKSTLFSVRCKVAAQIFEVQKAKLSQCLCGYCNLAFCSGRLVKGAPQLKGCCAALPSRTCMLEAGRRPL